MKANRKKGVLGLAAATLIGAGVSAASNVIGSIVNARKQKKANNAQLLADNQQNAMMYQQNLDQVYNNTDAVDDRKANIVLDTINNSQFRYGGPVIYRNRYCGGGMRIRRR